MCAWAIEKRLKRIKASKGRKGLDNGQEIGSNSLRLPANSFTDSDDEYEQAEEEDPPTIASETTCLLYDARQQQKQRDRLLSASTDHILHEASPAHITTIRNDSPGPASRRSSINSDVRRPSIEPILEYSIPPASASSRIHFSDSVRISGGIKSKREKRRISAASVFASPSAAADTDENTIASTSKLDDSPPPAGNHFSTERGSFSRNNIGRVSRAASFLSEDGNTTGRSRASTPASIYAPLLLPSKTAPSPSRHFYLTFQRDNGQATYRELVRQQKERKMRTRRGRPKNRRLTKAWASDEEDEEDSDSESDVNPWCCRLTFWTCGLSRVLRRHRGRRKVDDNEDATADLESADTGNRQDERSSATTSDTEESMSGRLENKSEMQVMFGSKPWRYLRLGYWLYRIRTYTGSRTNEEEEEW